MWPVGNRSTGEDLEGWDQYRVSTRSHLTWDARKLLYEMNARNRVNCRLRRAPGGWWRLTMGHSANNMTRYRSREHVDFVEKFTHAET